MGSPSPRQGPRQSPSPRESPRQSGHADTAREDRRAAPAARKSPSASGDHSVRRAQTGRRPHATGQDARSRVERPGLAERRDHAVLLAVETGLLSPDDAPLAAFLDLDAVTDAVADLRAAWPEDLDVRHTVAAKANSLVPVLRHLHALGLGCEVASAGELAQARAAGFRPEQIVLDGPVKTHTELAEALRAGIAVNLDNFEELHRVDQLVAHGATPAAAGIRINPQVGIGAIASTSTAGPTSKFGVPLGDPGSREELVNAYVNRPWLRWVHVHVGSQGIPADLTAAGVAAAMELAEDIEHVRPGQIEGVDIGGGIAVDYASDDAPSLFADHVAALRKAAPRLFSGRYRVITEFGRSLLAKSGFVAAYVETTKTAGGRRIALTHAGAQVATRTVYAPDEWPLRILAYGADGRPSTADPEVQDVAGPCCFAGDLLAGGRTLPRLASGDLVIVPDTGAYYFSTPYGYNSLPEPPVYGFQTAPDGTVAFLVLRAAETIAELVARSDRGGGVPRRP